jgi:hypothetical protein
VQGVDREKAAIFRPFTGLLERQIRSTARELDAAIRMAVDIARGK